jgi:hypothetical protein
MLIERLSKFGKAARLADHQTAQLQQFGREVMGVQLDLRAKKLVVTEHSKPLRLHLPLQDS